LRAALTILAILLIVVLTTALVGPYFIDWSQHRAALEAQLSNALGRPVMVRGPIKAALLPTPYLELGDVAVGGAEGDAGLSCQQARLELALAPLLHGEIRFTDALFERPRVEFQRGADGAILPPRLDVKLAPESIGLDTITLRDATIVVDSVGGAPPITIKGLDLDAQADSLRGPFKGAGHAAGADGEAIAFHFATGLVKSDAVAIKFAADLGAAALRVELDGSLSLTAENFGYSGAAAASGVFAGDDSAAPTPWRISGDAAANLDGATLQKLEARIGDDERALSLQGAAEAHFGASPRLNLTLGAKELNLDALLRAKGAESAPPERAYRALSALLTRAEFERGPSLPVAVKIDAPTIILGGDTIAAASLDATATPGAPIAVSLQALAPGRSQITASGEIELGAASHFKGALNVRVDDIERLREWVSQDDDDLRARLAAISAALPYRAASLAANVDLSQTSFVARDLSLGLGHSTLQGALIWTRAVGADRDRLFLDLTTDALDLDALPNFAAAGDFLSAVDLSLALEARAFRIARFGEGPVESGLLTLKLAKTGDDVTLDHLAIADLGGATISANGALKPNERWLNIDIDAQRLRDLALLARRVAPSALSQALVDRAGALSPAKLTLMARSSSAAKENVFAPDSLSIRGLVGETRVATKIDRASDAGDSLVAEFSLDAPEVSPLLRQLGLQAVPLTGLGRGSITARARGDWSKGFDVDAAASLAGADLTWRGHALGENATLEGAATLKAANVTPLLAAFGVVLPNAPPSGSADLSADVSWRDGEVVAARLKGAANGSNLTGDLSYHPAAPTTEAATPAGVAPVEPPAQIQGVVTLDHLSLGALASLALGPAQPAKPGQLWSDAKFSSGLASPPSTDVSLSIAALDIMSDLPARDASIRLKIGPGVVALDDMTMRAAGGAISGHATFRRDGANAALSGRITFDSIAVDRPGLSAKLAGVMDFADTGQSANGLSGGLAGAGHIQLMGAQLPRLDPDALSRVVDKAQAPGFEIENVDVNHLLATEMDRRPMLIADVSAPAAISAGVLRVGPFEGRHPSGAAKVQASLDLRSLALDIRADIAEGQAPKFWSGAPPAIGVALKGRIGALSRDIDSANLANGLEAQAIARETERIAEFEADIRERAAFNRRLKASRFLRQRELELDAFAADQARLKSEADRRRIEEEALKASEEEKAEAARKAEEARRAEEARKAEEEARKASAPPPLPPIAPPPPLGPIAAPTDIAPAALQPPPKPRQSLDPTANGIY
jgi:uncharacterized protein involved in outer membrane biogenesis